MGLLYGVSSFGHFASAASGKSFTGYAANKNANAKNIPNDLRDYFKTHWFNLFITLILGAFMITGQIFPLTAKFIDVAKVGIDALMGVDFSPTQAGAQNGTAPAPQPTTPPVTNPPAKH